MISRALMEDYENSRSSPGLVADCLERKHLDCEQSALLSWIGTADAFSYSDRMSEGYEVFSRYGMTFVPLTAERGAAELMLLLEGFLVRHLARRLEVGMTSPKICGQK